MTRPIESSQHTARKDENRIADRTPVLLGIALLAAFNGYLAVHWIGKIVDRGPMDGTLAVFNQLRDFIFHPHQDLDLLLLSAGLAAIPASVWGTIAAILLRKSGARPGAPALCAAAIAFSGPLVAMVVGYVVAWLFLTPAMIGLLIGQAEQQRHGRRDRAVAVGTGVAVGICVSLVTLSGLFFFAWWKTYGR